jgi:hypothetical protein
VGDDPGRAAHRALLRESPLETPRAIEDRRVRIAGHETSEHRRRAPRAAGPLRHELDLDAEGDDAAIGAFGVEQRERPHVEAPGERLEEVVVADREPVAGRMRRPRQDAVEKRLHRTGAATALRRRSAAA